MPKCRYCEKKKRLQVEGGFCSWSCHWGMEGELVEKEVREQEVERIKEEGICMLD